MNYSPLKNKCRAAVIRKAWRDAPDSRIKKVMLEWAERLSLT